MSRISFLVIFVVMLSPRAGAQDMSAGAENTMSLRGRHIIAVNAGILGGSASGAVSPGSVSADASTSGAVGFVGYAYGVRDNMTVGVTTGILETAVSADVGIGEIETETSAVVPVLFGVTYYPQALAISPEVCAFISAAAGPYVGSATNTYVGIGVEAESVSDTAFGSRLLGGIDWFISHHVRLGAGAGYHFVSDFSERIGRLKNYSGPEVSVGLGVMLGRVR